MHILLTGYKGFIGSHMMTSLLEDGHQVVGYEWNDPFPSFSNLDWVIHMGAISSTTERDVNKVMTQNYDSSIRLYEQCRHYGIKFQFSSSASVYGLQELFREDAPVDPRTPYAWSKYMFERYMNKRPLTVGQAFRYFNVYGPDGEEHKGDQASPFFKFKQQAEKFNQVTLFENSQYYVRDFIHVSKVIEMQKKFLNLDVSGVFNIGTGTTMSFLDVAKKYSNNLVEVSMPGILKSNYQAFTCADMNKTNTALRLLTNTRVE